MTEYYGDIAVGDRRELGTVTAEREEMLAFAQRYDPQPIHTDPEAAVASHFGGIIASGWYTASLCMRALVDTVLADSGAIGALGIEELRWPTPVRPGDILAVETVIEDKRPSESDPTRGLVTSRLSAENEAGETVLEWTATTLWARPGGD
jgi:acyl dehydratase